jgi:hypothetical protein
VTTILDPLLLVSYLACALRASFHGSWQARTTSTSDCRAMVSRIAVATRSRFDLLRQDELEQSESEDEIDIQEPIADVP